MRRIIGSAATVVALLAGAVAWGHRPSAGAADAYPGMPAAEWDGCLDGGHGARRWLSAYYEPDAHALIWPGSLTWAYASAAIDAAFRDPWCSWAAYGRMVSLVAGGRHPVVFFDPEAQAGSDWAWEHLDSDGYADHVGRIAHLHRAEVRYAWGHPVQGAVR